MLLLVSVATLSSYDDCQFLSSAMFLVLQPVLCQHNMRECSKSKGSYCIQGVIQLSECHELQACMRVARKWSQTRLVFHSLLKHNSSSFQTYYCQKVPCSGSRYVCVISHSEACTVKRALYWICWVQSSHLVQSGKIETTEGKNEKVYTKPNPLKTLKCYSSCLYEKHRQQARPQRVSCMSAVWAQRTRNELWADPVGVATS